MDSSIYVSKTNAVETVIFLIDIVIEPGTIHAIGAGITVAEIQESSNVTYRVCDYGGKDQTGNERELHVDKALEVTNTNRIKDQRIAVKKVTASLWMREAETSR